MPVNGSAADPRRRRRSGVPAQRTAAVAAATITPRRAPVPGGCVFGTFRRFQLNSTLCAQVARPRNAVLFLLFA